MNTGIRIVIGIIAGIITIAIAYNMGVSETSSLAIFGALGIWLSSYITGRYRKDMNDEE